MTRASDQPLLAARGLCKSFRGHLSVGLTQVLRGLDLPVDPGEIYGFIGANGAGKSSTLRTISGLVRASAGEISFQGERIDKLLGSDSVIRFKPDPWEEGLSPEDIKNMSDEELEAAYQKAIKAAED